jgi:hypothetical protein
MNRLSLIFLAALFPMLSLAQGLVNINTLALSSGRLVYEQYDRPLTGTNYVAQLVYGSASDRGSVTHLLGSPVWFRDLTTPNPGTWDAGAENIRTLNGFAEGDRVLVHVRVWDSNVFVSWEDAAAALASGGTYVSETFAGMTSFEYTVGSPARPASLLLHNFEGFSLTYIGCPCDPPCYSRPAPIRIGLWWNGAETNLNLLPLLGAYLSTNRPASAPQWTAETPVEQLFSNAAGNPYFEVSGTLGAARFVSRTNRLGDTHVLLSSDIGYRSYLIVSSRICGVQAGLVSIHIHRPPGFVFPPRVAGRLAFRLDGMPGLTYRILRSDHAGDFVPWATVVTDADGSFSGMSFLDQPDQPAAAFFKAEEVSR